MKTFSFSRGESGFGEELGGESEGGRGRGRKGGREERKTK